MAEGFDGEVEFLDFDAGDGSDGDGAEDGVDWLEESGDEERLGSGRDPRRLPPRATHRRVLASALSLAMVLGTAIGVGTAAYHRHESDVRIANMLTLAASSAAPSIPGLTALAFAAQWHAQVAEQVVIPVVNKGPHAVTLVDGTFTEAGLRGTPTLKPVGEAIIPPGGTGHLAGIVTADCTQRFDGIVAIDSPSSQPDPSATDGAYASTVTITGDAAIAGAGGSLQMQPRAGKGALKVRARAASGRVREQTIFPESGAADTADRICSQQGENVAIIGGVRVAVDPHAHAVTLSLSAKSVADTALGYIGTADWVTNPVAPELKLPNRFTPVTESGTVRPGGALTVSFRTTVEHCPSTPTFDDDPVEVSVMFVLDTNVISAVDGTIGARALINEACGHPADWKG